MAPERDELGKGLFISFEGCEGSGKSTQADLLKEALLNLGRDAIVSEEPGGTELGARIRQMLLDTSNQEITPLTEALLFAADRAQQVNEVIRPALKKGWTVIADRYVDSSLAYQGVGRGLGLNAVKNLNDWATSELEPAITFYLDIPYELASRRLEHVSPDRMESEPREFHENVRQAFLSLVSLYPSRIMTLDAAERAELINARVMQVVQKLL
jgi:dTMP kinase